MKHTDIRKAPSAATDSPIANIMPEVSVAMSVYNGERFLAPAIESVLSQTYTNFEFLILDDGSKDQTAAIIEAYAARDSRIRPIIRENRGLVASLNQLIAQSRAPLIARMDADDICLPERFAKQLAFLDAHPEFGVIGSRTYDIDDKDQIIEMHLPPHPETHEEFLAAIDHGALLLCHPSVMYRRDVVLAVGGYHAAFKHCEDLDLWLRLASCTRLGNLPDRLIRYRHYPEQVSSRHATVQQIGAAIARLAYYERMAGNADPTEKLENLPPIAALDSVFKRNGVAQQLRATVAHGLKHSLAALRDEGFTIIQRHLRDGGSRKGMWRTVARLVKYGEPIRALRLCFTLLTTKAL
ncbi:MAG: hypothetical protein RLY97_2072 [Pseudomonadota bacterium]